MPLITANGTGIFVECYGDPEAIPILLIRGLGSQIIHWPQAMLERFAALGFRIIMPDNRDAGLSQKFDGLETITAEEAARREADGLPIEAPYGVADFADDHFGVLEVELRQFSLQRLLGLGIVLFGAWWTLRH